MANVNVQIERLETVTVDQCELSVQVYVFMFNLVNCLL